MKDLRTLCDEAIQLWDADCDMDGVINEMRAALAQPEPLAATDEALASFTAYFCRNYPGPDTIIHRPEWHAPKIFRAAADAIARWGTPTTTRSGTH